MGKKVSFDKKVKFPTMIGEVSAISLEQNLYFLDEFNIHGEFLLNGKYKLTEASRLEEDFHYKIPIEIVLSEKIDLNATTIEITDFTYETDDDYMICHIEIAIDGVEIQENSFLNESNKNRECDGDLEKNIEIPSIEKTALKTLPEETAEEKLLESVEVSESDAEMSDEINVDSEDSLFTNLKDDDDSYGTFTVYIVRKDETLNSIVEKYHTTVEEIEKYNDISKIDIGTRLIIPFTND